MTKAQADAKALWAYRVLIRSLIELRSDVGGSLEVSVSGDGESFGVYLNGNRVAIEAQDAVASGEIACVAAAEKLVEAHAGLSPYDKPPTANQRSKRS